MWKRYVERIVPLCFCLVTGCVSKSEVYAPGGAVDGAREVSVRYLKTLYEDRPTRIDEELGIRGIVTDNSRYGNRFRTLVVQDETGGIEIKADGELCLDYPIGQEVAVYCRSLVLGGYGGTVSLGAPSSDPAYENGFIPGEKARLYIRKTGYTENLLPQECVFDGLSPLRVGCFVSFEGVQFVDEELYLPWSEPDRDTDRHLVDRKGDTLVVRTRREAEFATKILPSGSGHIEGILGWFNGTYQLHVIDSRNAVMEGARFVPVAER